MFDWLAVGWNLAMTVAGAFLVSLSFRRWPLNLGTSNAALHTLLTVVTVYMIGVYPHGLLRLPAALGTTHADTLIYVPLVTLILAYRPAWALLAGLPTILASLLLHRSNGLSPGSLSPDSLYGAGPLIAIVGTLLVAATQKRRLNLLHFSDREAAFRLPLIFLPTGLPLLLGAGWHAGILPALLLMALNLIGFLTGTLVLRSRFRLLATSARLARQAFTDPLTGLWNRRKLEQDLADLPVGGHVLLLDLDYFKSINDRFGHDVGDAYLTSTGAALNRALREVRAGGPPPGDPPAGRRYTDAPAPVGGSAQAALAYRMGGEEFALLLTGATTEQAALLAETTMRQVRDLRHRANPGGQLTCSVGLAQRVEGETAQQTLRRADTALMQAKTNGRDRMEFAEAGADAPATGLKPETVRPDQPLLWEAVHSSLSLATLDREPTTDDWTRLLKAAVLSVPTAEAGTIYLRRGGGFVLCAQVGFDDGLLELRQTEQELLDWYGLGAAAWKRGQPRVLYGEHIAVMSDTGEEGRVGAEGSLYHRFGRIAELQASLCLPVLTDGEVVGHLNLDRSSDDRPFDADDLRAARVFADQMAVLTVNSRQREAFARQQEEQEWLLDFCLGLLPLPDAGSVALRLLNELEARYGLHGQLRLEAPPGAAPAGGYVLPLAWPGQPGAFLLLRRNTDFSETEQRLMRQAARVAADALVSLRLRWEAADPDGAG